MDEQVTYHPLVMLHDIMIVLKYSILGYGFYACPSKLLQSFPTGLFCEGRRQYQHLGAFFVPSQTDEQHGPVYISLLARNIQAVPLPSTRPFLQHRMQADGLIQLHMVATPFEIAK